MTPPAPAIRGGVGRGLLLAVLAYGIWGFLPLFFRLLFPATALEIVSWRVLFSLVFCSILLTVTRAWPRVLAILRDRRMALTLLLAGVFILINWLVYVYATISGQVLQAALGYFTNPIFTVLLGVFVLRERLRALQWLAVGVSAVAVLVVAISYGAFPWITVALALSFGMYGLIKRRVGARVDALSGLTIETLWLAPLAIGEVVFIAATTGLTIGHTSLLQTVSMCFAGVITAVPLLLFAGAARRVPLTVIGLTQYLTPIVQVLIGVFLMGEAMTASRLIGFCIVWVALIILSIDMFRSARAARRVEPEPAPV